MAKVYIDFDSIFDTRIALIQHLSRPAARRVVRTKKYFDRLADDFWNTDNAIKQAEWEDIWENRGSRLDFNTLQMTDVVVELYKEKVERDNLMASGVDVTMDDLVINLWPYKIDEVAEKHLAEEFTVIGFKQVSFINIDPVSLQASFFHSGYRQVIMYDMNRWLSSAWRSVAEDPLIKTRFISPLFIKGEGNLSMSIGELAAKASEEFKPYFIYNPLPSNMFCFMVD